MRRQWSYGVAAVLAITLSACSQWGSDESVVAPSNDASLTAAIRAPILETVGAQPDQTALVCSGDGKFVGPLDIVMSAGESVDLHEVDLSLLDAMQRALDENEFSHDDLAKAFGTTVIPGPTTRTFRFHTNLWCRQTVPQFVVADIKFTDASGRKNRISVSAPFNAVLVNRNGS